MEGYRQTEFDPDAGEPEVQQPKGRWKWFLGIGAYMIPLFSLWSMDGFPERFGVPECHGRGCIIADWYHSYLLVERHSLLDVATFLYMWIPLVVLIAWFVVPKLKRPNFSLYDDDGTQPAPSALNQVSIVDSETSAERNREIMVALAVSLVFGVLLIALILYFKGA